MKFLVFACFTGQHATTEPNNQLNPPPARKRTSNSHKKSTSQKKRKSKNKSNRSNKSGNSGKILSERGRNKVNHITPVPRTRSRSISPPRSDRRNKFSIHSARQERMDCLTVGTLQRDLEARTIGATIESTSPSHPTNLSNGERLSSKTPQKSKSGRTKTHSNGSKRSGSKDVSGVVPITSSTERNGNDFVEPDFQGTVRRTNHRSHSDHKIRSRTASRNSSSSRRKRNNLRGRKGNSKD